MDLISLNIIALDIITMDIRGGSQFLENPISMTSILVYVKFIHSVLKTFLYQYRALFFFFFVGGV